MMQVETKNLINLRNNYNLTLKEVSNATGLSISMLSKLENGKIAMSPKSAKILSNFYNIELTPSRIIMTYDNSFPLKDHHYKSINKVLKNENCKLKEENEKLKKIINKIKTEISDT